MLMFPKTRKQSSGWVRGGEAVRTVQCGPEGGGRQFGNPKETLGCNGKELLVTVAGRIMVP